MPDLVQIGAKPERHHLYDSMTKTLLTFFAAVAKEPLTYEGETVQPIPLIVSPLVFRGFTCPEGCGACCGKATLDYIPGEPRPQEAAERIISVNGKQFVLYSDLQTDHSNYFCRHLDASARCSAYQVRPFSCDFALLNVNRYATHSVINCRKFGRFHKWLRHDGVTRGTMCEMLDPTDEWIANTRRRLARLMIWVSYFGIETWMPEVIQWASQNPYTIKPLRLGFKDEQSGTGLTGSNTSTSSISNDI